MAIDLSNWREGSNSAWSFINVDEILATHPIQAGNHPTPLPEAHESSEDFEIKTPSNDSLDLATFLSTTNTDSLVVLHKGKIVFEHYANGNTTTSKHILMSITKSITGLLVGILADQGKIDIDAPVKKYVQEASHVFDGVTVRECLDMRSGVRLRDDAHEYRAAAGWTPMTGTETAGNLHELIEHLEVPTDSRPAYFDYRSINTDLLGWVIERATGQTLAQALSEHLWIPIGASHSATLTVDAVDYARAAGGLCATARDVALLGQVIIDGGRSIIPSSWIEDLVHGGDRAVFAQGAWAPGFAGLRDFPAPAYRSFWTTDRESNVLLALGIQGQHLLVDRQRDLVMVKMSSQPNPADSIKVRLAILAFEEFRRILVAGM